MIECSNIISILIQNDTIKFHAANDFESKRTTAMATLVK